jgi:type IV pilus assembly protein PilO
LEDISSKGELNGLRIETIDLRDEILEEFYVELPISISATGSYHDLGAFISGMAGLPRIVTLHDFEIEMSDDDSANLDMNITARTYRYRDDPDEE